MNNLIDKIRNTSYNEANSIIRHLSGIVSYFSSEEEKSEFISIHNEESQLVCEDRVSYGDWQTPASLAEKVCENHISRYGNPDIVIEPTCGLGAFVFAALEKFPDVSEIHALEINPHYTAELKLKLLLNALRTSLRKHPDIYIYNGDFFTFDFSAIITESRKRNLNLAIIGNPPWVTNSRQGRNNSDNIPLKKNIYGLKGIDAITGKSNFDISEYITLELLKVSQHNRGGISFLLKNSVIRNILMKQHSEHIHIGDIEQQAIDASSEFNVSVDASCFSARLDCRPAMTCGIRDLYTNSYIREYGWVNNAFVSDAELYCKYSKYDSCSGYTWRSGIKHDCSAVLELTLSDGVYRNGFGETVDIEDDMIYPLLKSSDINRFKENGFRKYIIVTQRRTGEDTSVLKYTHPLTYSYLTRYEAAFAGRKSSIYKGKDKFSVFGVGDYTFKPYKILVSSLYKTVNFILVSQHGGKPIIVDDTCYQLDFDNQTEAANAYEALNSTEIQSLLKALMFKDAKRVVTKNLLMRLDLTRICREKGATEANPAAKDCLNPQLSLFEK